MKQAIHDKKTLTREKVQKEHNGEIRYNNISIYPLSAGLEDGLEDGLEGEGRDMLGREDGRLIEGRLPPPRDIPPPRPPPPRPPR